MGKFKVNFTTALFVFSFIICVIVAVVFVDRAPKNDYDSFYDEDGAGAHELRRRDQLLPEIAGHAAHRQPAAGPRIGGLDG